MSSARSVPLRPLAAQLAEIYADTVAACDGARLVERALTSGVFARELASTTNVNVLAIGKAAVPMTEGLLAHAGYLQPTAGLVITTAPLAANARLPAALRVLAAEHPVPGAGSLAAGAAARAFVAAVDEKARLIVLLSGGGSALACLPTGALSLSDKVAAVTELVARGAPIHDLNAVRKHLSAIKGGQLGALLRSPALVLALSDVIGDDLSVIASGPFHPDPTTYADALAVVARHQADLPRAVHEHLAKGAAGGLPETPKPAAAAARAAGNVVHHAHHIVAGPRDVVRAARAAIAARGLHAVDGALDTGLTVEALAADYTARTTATAASLVQDVIHVGNGEPRVVLPPGRQAGRGGRASHLALLMAKALRGRGRCAFLAAGTDDRDGSSDATGAVVDGHTWADALALGLDPQAALDGYDSATLLARLGARLVAPARSNLLDLHLLAAASATVRSEPATRDDRA